MNQTVFMHIFNWNITKRFLVLTEVKRHWRDENIRCVWNECVMRRLEPSSHEHMKLTKVTFPSCFLLNFNCSSFNQSHALPFLLHRLQNHLHLPFIYGNLHSFTLSCWVCVLDFILFPFKKKNKLAIMSQKSYRSAVLNRWSKKGKRSTNLSSVNACPTIYS